MQMSISKKLHFQYWIFPSILSGIFIYMYFSGIPFLQELVSPSINREFGLLENVQLIFLLICISLSIKGITKSQIKFDKLIFTLLALGFTFLFLEEIDYGLHYLEFFNLREAETEVRNLHNQGNLLGYMKKTMYAVVFIFFIILPFLQEKFNKFYLATWIPSKLIIITAMCLTIWSQIAQFIYHSTIETNNSLEKNISEYEELLVYYLFLVYVIEMIQRKNPKFAK